MNSATPVLVIIAASVAFWTGSRWRHNTRTWTDHKATVAGEKALRKLRWVTLKAALAAIGVTVLVLMCTGAITFAGQGPAHRPGTTHPTPASSRPSPRPS